MGKGIVLVGGILGGSFLKVVIYRLPRRKDRVWGRSVCPKINWGGKFCKAKFTPPNSPCSPDLIGVRPSRHFGGMESPIFGSGEWAVQYKPKIKRHINWYDNVSVSFLSVFGGRTSLEVRPV